MNLGLLHVEFVLQPFTFLSGSITINLASLLKIKHTKGNYEVNNAFTNFVVAIFSQLYTHYLVKMYCKFVGYSSGWAGVQ